MYLYFCRVKRANYCSPSCAVTAYQKKCKNYTLYDTVAVCIFKAVVVEFLLINLNSEQTMPLKDNEWQRRQQSTVYMK